MGASAALQMAILAPEKVLSLFMLSPPPVTEVRSLNVGPWFLN
jgi:pimeloyl-ACP methyl ester carboxylesterase